MYTDRNYRTKKALKEDLAAGRKITIYQPGQLFNPPEASPTYTGKAYVEGPHYPRPHTWYAEVDLVDGKIVKVR